MDPALRLIFNSLGCLQFERNIRCVLINRSLPLLYHSLGNMANRVPVLFPCIGAIRVSGKLFRKSG